MILCLIGCAIGALVVYLILRPKLKSVQKIDNDIVQKNSELSTELAVLISRKEELNNGITDLQKYSEEYFTKNKELAEARLEVALEQAAEKYQSDEEEYREEYRKTLEECAEEFANAMTNQKEEIEKLSITLKRLRALVDAAVEANKRETAKAEQVDFYRLVLSEQDIEEIKRLREVLPYLRNKEPLNKVIYKCYYEKPYTDLIGRVLGQQTKTGIYKITNIQNNMCYVGQAVNIADRWKQHIKRGVGAETPTQNKLYPIMYKIGVENFTFEIVEECSRTDLNEREDYWQEYFHAKDFGYSIK